MSGQWGIVTAVDDVARGWVGAVGPSKDASASAALSSHCDGLRSRCGSASRTFSTSTCIIASIVVAGSSGIETPSSN